MNLPIDLARQLSAVFYDHVGDDFLNSYLRSYGSYCREGPYFAENDRLNVRTPGFYLIAPNGFQLIFNPILIIVPIIGRYFDVKNEPIFVNARNHPTLTAFMSLSSVIINADDFGISSVVNRAILFSVEQGLVTSTSIMANMPGFEEAVSMEREYDVLRGRVGVHLNLTEGKPLTEPILGCGVFCDSDGSFFFKRERPLFRLGKPVRDAAYEELRSQLQRVVEMGIIPTHLDSHHHIHTEWAIAPLVCGLAKEFRIPRIRLTRNMGRPPSFLKRLYKAIFNRWHLGRQTGLHNTDLFGDIPDMLYEAKSGWPEGKNIEIMVHPLFNENGELVDMNQKPLQQALAPILRQPLNLSPLKSELHS